MLQPKGVSFFDTLMPCWKPYFIDSGSVLPLFFEKFFIILTIILINAVIQYEGKQIARKKVKTMIDKIQLKLPYPGQSIIHYFIKILFKHCCMHVHLYQLLNIKINIILKLCEPFAFVLEK